MQRHANNHMEYIVNLVFTPVIVRAAVGHNIHTK